MLANAKNSIFIERQAGSFVATFADEAAVTSIEYALIASLIAAVIISTVAIVGERVLALYEVVRLAVEAAM